MKVYIDKEFHISSLTALFRILDINHSPTTIQQQQWIFRGQDDYTHDLLPGIGRPFFKGEIVNEEDRLQLEKQAFSVFEVQSYTEIKERNRFMILGAAQHHGLKTRYLDWSFSPLVALFFAVENPKYNDRDAALFVYKPRAVVNILRKKGSPLDKIENSSYNWLLLPPISPRISAQSALVQLYHNPIRPMKSITLTKYFIPAESKEDLKADLFNAGITYRTLFPDLNGLAATINHTHFRI